MYKIPKRQEAFQTSQAIYDKIIHKDHFLVKVNEHVDFSFINDQLKDTYCPDNGRPTTNYPSRMLKALWLSIHYDLTDRETEDQANENIIIKWFLGYNIDEKPFDHSALGAFRDRLGEEGCKEAFFQIKEQIKKAGFISPGESNTIDATHVLSKTAYLTVPQMIHRAVIKLFQEIHCFSPHLENEIKKSIGFEGDITKIPKDYGISESEKLDRLTRLVLLAQSLVVAINSRLSSISDEKTRSRLSSSTELVQRIIYEQIKEEKTDEDKVKYREKDREEKPKDRVVNPSDPDARNGHKSSKKPFTGYKVTFTQNENEFITNVRTDPGNFVDGDAQLPMTDELEERDGKRPNEMIGDKAYGEASVRHEQKNKGTRVVAPLKKPFNKTGKYPYTRFNYNPDTDTMICPYGRTGKRIGYNKKQHSTVYRFSEVDCGNCPLRDQCTSSSARTVNISDYEPDIKEAAEFNKTEEYKSDMKRRSGHERKNSEAKYKHGMKTARYWGRIKMGIQGYMTGITLNIKLFIKKLESEEGKPHGVALAMALNG